MEPLETLFEGLIGSEDEPNLLHDTPYGTG